MQFRPVNYQSSTSTMKTVKLFLTVAAVILLHIAAAEAGCSTTEASYVYIQIPGTSVVCNVTFQSTSNKFRSCGGSCSNSIKHDPEVRFGGSLSDIPDSDVLQSCKGPMRCCAGISTVQYSGTNVFAASCIGSSVDYASMLRFRMPSGCECRDCHSDSYTTGATTMDAAHCQSDNIQHPS